MSAPTPPQPEPTMAPLTQCHQTQGIDRRLKPNPFTTYRDPQTGKWMVVKPT
ncbi:MAG TPA: hypothetical protein V6C78_19720 [Crinalium sp.]